MARPSAQEVRGHRSPGLSTATGGTCGRDFGGNSGPGLHFLTRRAMALWYSLRRSLSLNSPSRARTCDLAVNSRSLYQLSYRGIHPKSKAAKHTLAATTAVSVKNQISISLSRFIWGCRYRKIAGRTQSRPRGRRIGISAYCHRGFRLQERGLQGWPSAVIVSFSRLCVRPEKNRPCDGQKHAHPVK
jgi:hypothetical protein